MLVDLLRPVYRQRRLIWQGTALALLVTLVLAGTYLYRQPGRQSVSVGFRPAFEGATDGKYPNGLPFATTDVVAASIVEQVHRTNGIQDYCPIEGFRSGLAVIESSPELEFLNLEFQQRLGASGLTQIEREQLLAEYQNRKSALPFHYRLQFTESLACRLPEALAVKALSDTLETWAQESERKRGVANLRVSVLSPVVFDQVAGAPNLLIQADVLRTTVTRVIRNIHRVAALPGSELIRDPKAVVSLEEVRIKLEDLLQAQLEPLIVQAGRSFGSEAIQWVDHALQAAEIQLRAAEQRAEAYKTALREYSGVATSPAPLSAIDRPQSPSDVQALTPQIDRTFIDRILEMSTANTTFRQEITRRSIDAAVEAVTQRVIVAQYQQLREALSRPSGSPMTVNSLPAQLSEISNQAKAATAQFNAIYQEFSRIALRPGPALYHVDSPAKSTVLRAFTGRDVGFLLLAVLFLIPVIMALGILANHYARRFVVVMRQSPRPPSA